MSDLAISPASTSGFSLLSYVPSISPADRARTLRVNGCVTVGGLSSGLRESGPSHATWPPRQRPTRGGGGRFHMHARGGGKRGSRPPPRGVVVAMAMPLNLTKAFFRYPKSLSLSLSGIVCHCGGCGNGGTKTSWSTAVPVTRKLFTHL